MKARSFLIDFSEVADVPDRRFGAGFQTFIRIAAKVSRSCWFRQAFALGIPFLVFSAAISAQSGPCECKDKADLLNLLNMDHAVIDGLREYSQKVVKPTDLMNEIASAKDPKKRTKGDLVNEVIRQQIDWVRNREAKTASGVIDGVSCRVKTEAQTDCLKKILEERAAESSMYCRGFRQHNKIGENEDVLNFMPLNDYLDWQIALYKNEIKTILTALDKMKPHCRPKNWIGMITVHEDITNYVTIKNETTDDNTIRSGVIRFNGELEEPLASWQVAGRYIYTKIGQEGRRDCTGGLATAKPDTAYKTSFTMEINKTGGGKPLSTTVDVGEPEADNQVFIGVRIPELMAQWDFNSMSKRESGCPKDSLMETNLFTTDVPLSSEPLNFKAIFTMGNPKKGEPAQMIEVVGPVQDSLISNPGAKMSHTHWVGVHLYKLQ